MPFVQAKCPNCGGFLAVDSSKDAAVCQFCNTPFIVEKAVNNYNVTVSGSVVIDAGSSNINIGNGPSVENLIIRGNDYLKDGNYDKAYEYFNKVLDIDARNVEALNGIKRINEIKNEQLRFNTGKYDFIMAFEQFDSINNVFLSPFVGEIFLFNDRAVICCKKKGISFSALYNEITIEEKLDCEKTFFKTINRNYLRIIFGTVEMRSALMENEELRRMSYNNPRIVYNNYELLKNAFSIKNANVM